MSTSSLAVLGDSADQTQPPLSPSRPVALRAGSARSATVTEAAAAAAAARSARAAAVTDAVAVAPGMVMFGLALGVVIATTVVGTGAGLLGTGLIFGGSAQLTATTMLEQGAGLLAVVVAAAMVNARLLLYSASLEPAFREQPRWFRLVAPHLIIDQTYLSAIARPELSGAAFRTYWLRLGGYVMIGWCLSVAAGIAVGPQLPPLPHLGLVGTALFLGMLVVRMVDAPAVAAALTSAVVAPLAALAMPEAGIVAGALAGLAAGTVTARRRS